MKKVIIALILVLMLLLFLIACDKDEDILPQEIEIENSSIEEFYFQDNNINYGAIKLKVTYIDGTSEVIALKSNMVSGFNPDTLGEQTITVTYNNKTTTFIVIVVPESFNVNYIAGANGTISGITTQTVSYGENAGSVRAIPNDGYVFSGWSDGLLNSRRTDSAIKNNISVTANFTLATYKVRFYSRNGDLISSCDVIKGGQAIIPDYDTTQTGFDYIGWSKKSDGTSVNLDNIESNLDVIATYTIKKVNVNFYDLSDNLIQTKVIDYGSSVATPEAPLIYGYLFSHWVIRGTSTVAVLSNIIAETDFEPAYMPVNFTITFNSDGGSIVNSISIPYLSSPSYLPETTKLGMSFVGWYSASVEGILIDTNYIITGNITLYARWEIKKCTVYFNTLGGTVVNSVTVNYGSKISPPSSPTRVGHTFSNWFTAETEGVTYNFNNTVTNNFIIYARWIPITYTVQFVANGGTAVSSVNAQYGTTITSPDSVRTGYTLAGWTLNTVTNSLFDFNTLITGNTTLYAVWQEVMITVYATCSIGGSVSPNGAISIGYDKSIVINITPDSGYRIKSMTVNSIAVTISNTYTLNRSWNTLYVEFEILKYEITATVKVAGGSITPSGKISVNYGSSQQYTMEPNVGYKIDLVKVNNVSLGSITSYIFNNVQSNQNIEVYFSKITYTITSTTTAGGTISPLGTVQVEYGSSKTYTITAATNYHIHSIKINTLDVDITDIRSMSVNITDIRENKTIAVTFIGDTYNITASSGANGSISPSGFISQNFGTSIVFTMTPEFGYKVSSIIVNGNNVGNSNQYTFSTSVLSSDNTIVVNYELDSYNINWSLIGSGTCELIGAIPVLHGDSRTFNVTPSENYHMTQLSFTMRGITYTVNAGEDNSTYSYSKIGNVYTLLFKAITGNISINILISIDTYNLVISPGANGRVVINSETTITSIHTMVVNYGTSVSLTVMPNTGYHISSIIRNGTGLTEFNITSHTFTVHITNDQNVSTGYTINSYDININVTGNGVVKHNSAIVNSFTANYNTTPAINLVPDTGYHIEHLKINGSNVSNPQQYYTFNAITNNVNVDVKYSIDMFSIITQQHSNGSITWSEGYISVRYGSTDYLNVPYGDTVTYTFTPNVNYHINYLEVKTNGGTFMTLTDGHNDNLWEYTIANGIGTLIIKDIKEIREMEISFAINTYTVTATSSANGSISPIGTSTVNYGNNISYIISANAGYQLSVIRIDGQAIVIEQETIYTFISVTTDHTIHVEFTLI